MRFALSEMRRYSIEQVPVSRLRVQSVRCGVWVDLASDPWDSDIGRSHMLDTLAKVALSRVVSAGT